MAFIRSEKRHIDGGQRLTVRNDNAFGCAAATDGSVLYYARALTQTTGVFDFEIRAAKPENGPSELLGRVSGSRVPVSPLNFQPYLSPDGKWLAMPLNDGSTSNLWALSTSEDMAEADRFPPEKCRHPAPDRLVEGRKTSVRFGVRGGCRYRDVVGIELVKLVPAKYWLV